MTQRRSASCQQTILKQFTQQTLFSNSEEGIEIEFGTDLNSEKLFFGEPPIRPSIPISTIWVLEKHNLLNH
jgi:hypothetical protein